jgi:RNA polymerase sigma-70 factor (ECF subfamily)
MPDARPAAAAAPGPASAHAAAPAAPADHAAPAAPADHAAPAAPADHAAPAAPAGHAARAVPADHAARAAPADHAARAAPADRAAPAVPALPADTAAHRAAERAARDSYGRLLALLAAHGGDLATAEDALGDAFAAALAHWPLQGVPDRPAAWLLTAARRRLLDGHRRRATHAQAAPELLRRAALPDDPAALPDHRLALLLACADPAVEPGARAPLMLQVVLGLDAARIASAFLVAPRAMAQRLVRAKRRLKGEAGAFALPGPDQVAERLTTVLAAIYAAYTAGAADHADGGALAGEALWLARLCAALAPTEPEALGLAALLLHLEARRPAGRDAAGAYVPLSAQDPARWDAALQAEAERLLRRAGAIGRPGRYQWEAAVASAHAARRHTGETDWDAILLLYDALAAETGSPVIAVNRAVAVAAVRGPAAGLAALRDALRQDARLADYQPCWAAMTALAERAGEAGAAATARQRAIGLATDSAVRRFLLLGGAGAGRGGR